MNYQELKTGDVLQKNDEYSAHNQDWKPIPNFMIDDKVPDCPHTHWRRPIVPNSRQKIERKNMWKSIRNLFKKS